MDTNFTLDNSKYLAEHQNSVLEQKLIHIDRSYIYIAEYRYEADRKIDHYEKWVRYIMKQITLFQQKFLMASNHPPSR